MSELEPLSHTTGEGAPAPTGPRGARPEDRLRAGRVRVNSGIRAPLPVTDVIVIRSLRICRVFRQSGINSVLPIPPILPVRPVISHKIIILRNCSALAARINKLDG